MSRSSPVCGRAETRDILTEEAVHVIQKETNKIWFDQTWNSMMWRERARGAVRDGYRRSRETVGELDHEDMYAIVRR